MKDTAKEALFGVKHKLGEAKEKVKESLEEGKNRLVKREEIVYPPEKDYWEDFQVKYEYHYKKSEKPTRFVATH